MSKLPPQDDPRWRGVAERHRQFLDRHPWYRAFREEQFIDLVATIRDAEQSARATGAISNEVVSELLDAAHGDDAEAAKASQPLATHEESSPTREAQAKSEQLAVSGWEEIVKAMRTAHEAARGKAESPRRLTIPEVTPEFAQAYHIFYGQFPAIDVPGAGTRLTATSAGSFSDTVRLWGDYQIDVALEWTSKQLTVRFTPRSEQQFLVFFENAVTGLPEICISVMAEGLAAAFTEEDLGFSPTSKPWCIRILPG